MLRVIISLSIASVLIACAPELPEDGTPSAFDGKWTGKAQPNQSSCEAFDLFMEVKFGHLIGEIRDGTKLGDVWGKIGPDGRIVGDLGIRGAVNAEAEVALDAANGTGIGSYSTPLCSGGLTFQRSARQ